MDDCWPTPRTAGVISTSGSSSSLEALRSSSRVRRWTSGNLRSPRMEAASCSGPSETAGVSTWCRPLAVSSRDFWPDAADDLGSLPMASASRTGLEPSWDSVRVPGAIAHSSCSPMEALLRKSPASQEHAFRCGRPTGALCCCSRALPSDLLRRRMSGGLCLCLEARRSGRTSLPVCARGASISPPSVWALTTGTTARCTFPIPNTSGRFRSTRPPVAQALRVK